MEEEESETRDTREDRPSNTPDGRDVRELEPRSMEEIKMKEIWDGGGREGNERCKRG